MRSWSTTLTIAIGTEKTLKPAGLSFTAAAALPLAGAAAVAAVEAIDPQPGQSVLVNGASGGVGSYTIQLLAPRGVTVLATGTSQDSDRLRPLGASQVIDYTIATVLDQVRASHPDGVDALVNLAGFTAVDVPLDAVAPGPRLRQLPHHAPLPRPGAHPHRLRQEETQRRSEA